MQLHPSRIALSIGISLLSCACGSPRTKGPDLSIPPGFDARNLAMRSGDGGAPLDWAKLQRLVEESDVIVVGEQHDDHFGHLFQQAITESVLSKYENSSISMEMLQRDEQSFINDYLSGVITQEQFLRRVPIGWTPGASWVAWYQGMIESARLNQREVVGANAPRRYVRLARTGGKEALQELSELSAMNFTLSEHPSTGGYVDRFREFFMGGHGEGDSEEANMSPDELAEKEKAMAASFRSQSLWDSTMAASIAMTRARTHGKVVHLVGQFHSDFHGGLIQQLGFLDPEMKILVISMQPKSSDAWDEGDQDRADVVVYTTFEN